MKTILLRPPLPAAWLPLAFCVVCIVESQGQTLVSPALQSEEEKPPSEPPREFVFTLRAAAEPDPPFTHRFWPASEDRQHANPMPFVSRAILLAAQFNYDRDASLEFNEEFLQWYDLPLAELPIDRVRNFVDRYAPQPLDELSRIENLMGLQYDLRFNELSATGIISTLLPEVQEMRVLARLLVIRARLAVADHRWQDFERDIRVGMRLSHVAGHSSDFLVNRLVGYAIAESMYGVIEEAIQQPGCPNLYWALATIPADDLFEMRESLEFESVVTTRLLDGNDPLPETIIGPDSARQRLLRLFREVIAVQEPSSNDDDTNIRAKLLAGIYVVSMAKSSRELLSKSPAWSSRVSELSAPEAVLRATEIRFHRSRDEWLKWSILPEAVAAPYGDRIEAALMQTEAKNDFVLSIIGSLYPAVDAVRRATVRLHQIHNFLCTIEAIRMHAAVDGSLPRSIELLHPVPVRDDTIARTQFGYHLRTPNHATMTRAPRHSKDLETTIQLRLIK